MSASSLLPAPPEAREFEFHDRDFRRVCELIHRHAGIALGPAKRDMVYGRLSRRLRTLGIDSFREYLDRHPQVDAIEAWAPYILDHGLTGIYHTVHCVDVLQASDAVLNSCDVVYMGDVIEHITKPDALALLERIRVPIVINTSSRGFGLNGGNVVAGPVGTP